MEKIIEFDTWLLLGVNGLNNQYVDTIMLAFTGKSVWIFMYIAIAYVMTRRYGWRGALIAISAVGIAVGLSDYVCASVIRPVFERLRPSNIDNEISQWVHIVNGYRSGKYGFPSCHAANTFALALSTSLLLKDKWYTVFIFVWAILQCYSRIYLGVHYPGDIAVGAFIGSAFALIMYYVATLPIRKYASANDNASPMAAIAVGMATILFIIIKSLIRHILAE